VIQSDYHKVLILEDDVIDIYYNSSLKKKPYLIKLTNYDNETYELRCDEEDLRKFYTLLNRRFYDDV
jgi:hypothetical protein